MTDEAEPRAPTPEPGGAPGTPDPSGGAPQPPEGSPDISGSPPDPEGPPDISGSSKGTPRDPEGPSEGAPPNPEGSPDISGSPKGVPQDPEGSPNISGSSEGAPQDPEGPSEGPPLKAEGPPDMLGSSKGVPQDPEGPPNVLGASKGAPPNPEGPPDTLVSSKASPQDPEGPSEGSPNVLGASKGAPHILEGPPNTSGSPKGAPQDPEGPPLIPKGPPSASSSSEGAPRDPEGPPKMSGSPKVGPPEMLGPLRAALEAALRREPGEPAPPELQPLLGIPLPPQSKCQRLDGARLLRDNLSLDSGGAVQGLGALRTALSILEKYGRNLLQPRPPRHWRGVRFGNPVFRGTVGAIRGGREVLGLLGYTEQTGEGLSFPEGVGAPHGPRVARVTADVLLLRAEIDLLLANQHPNPHFFTELLQRGAQELLVQDAGGRAGDTGLAPRRPPSPTRGDPSLLPPKWPLGSRCPPGSMGQPPGAMGQPPSSMGQPPSSSGWACASCTFLNPGPSVLCGVCERPRLARRPPPAPQCPQGWPCPHCTFWNEGPGPGCSVCRGSRDETPTPPRPLSPPNPQAGPRRDPRADEAERRRQQRLREDGSRLVAIVRGGLCGAPRGVSVGLSGGSRGVLGVLEGSLWGWGPSLGPSVGLSLGLGSQYESQCGSGVPVWVWGSSLALGSQSGVPVWVRGPSLGSQYGSGVPVWLWGPSAGVGSPQAAEAQGVPPEAVWVAAGQARASAWVAVGRARAALGPALASLLEQTGSYWEELGPLSLREAARAWIRAHGDPTRALLGALGARRRQLRRLRALGLGGRGAALSLYQNGGDVWGAAADLQRRRLQPLLRGQWDPEGPLDFDCPDQQALCRRVLASLGAGSWGRAALVAALGRELGLGRPAGPALRELLEAVRGCGDPGALRRRLRPECGVCGTPRPRDQMLGLAWCECSLCPECFRLHFTIAVREREGVRGLVCPACARPDLADDAQRLAYFSTLDVQLRQHLDPPTYQLFTQKLTELELLRDPQFLWCPQCSFGFIFEAERGPAQCPQCQQLCCPRCRHPWDPAHASLSCSEFQSWLSARDPQAGAVGLAAFLQEQRLGCPGCGLALCVARGGCLHCRCPRCLHHFCSACRRPFYTKDSCPDDRCPLRGSLHGHHPRRCLFYLRDWDPSRLQRLLNEAGVPFETDPPPGVAAAPGGGCGVLEQKEAPEGLRDEPCGRETAPGHGGLCRSHYVEYLARLVWLRGLDPLPLYDEAELLAAAERHLPGGRPPRVPPESPRGYLRRLRHLLRLHDGADADTDQP
ncbi:E3 ubiquitin-protein ligase RNF31 [Phaenicophaeus curvirostris]|uniref:E3 ubiquitin-protein ligase RNF31 n=1 Tax=Phaenicophaeus curvirostris TaxID=33595 RepID=UPI0037F0B968